MAVEACNRKRRKVYGIEPLVHRLPPNRFPDPCLGQKHVLVLPGKHTARSYAPRAQRAAVFRLRHARRICTRRRRVDRTGSFQSQHFVRTLFIVLAAKTIKGLLLRAPVGRRRRSRFLFQSAMHAFVPPVLFRMPRRNALRHNPQLHPPHRQARKPRHRARCYRSHTTPSCSASRFPAPTQTASSGSPHCSLSRACRSCTRPSDRSVRNAPGSICQPSPRSKP